MLICKLWIYFISTVEKSFFYKTNIHEETSYLRQVWTKAQKKNISCYLNISFGNYGFQVMQNIKTIIQVLVCFLLNKYFLKRNVNEIYFHVEKFIENPEGNFNC